jgi:hypothetical protein
MDGGGRGNSLSSGGHHCVTHKGVGKSFSIGDHHYHRPSKFGPLRGIGRRRCKH